jgi:hypothetical protein
MLEITNQELFGKVIAAALAKVELTVTDARTKSRWINAISKAAAEIEENGVFMTWQEDDQSLLIWSQKTNNIYTANGVCQCRAFEQGSACFHRAAARLVRLYLETAQAASVQTEEIPYLKPTVDRPVERVGGIRIN